MVLFVIEIINLISKNSFRMGSRNKYNLQLNTSEFDQTIMDNQRINNELLRMRDHLSGLYSKADDVDDINEKRLLKRNVKFSTNQFSSNYMKKNKLGLRKVLEQQKVKNIVRNFLNKLKRNTINSTPVEYQPYEKKQSEGFFFRVGYRIPIQIELFYAISNILLILIISFIYPLTIIFENFMDEVQMFNIQLFCFFFYLIEMAINFIGIKLVDGKRVQLLKDIFLEYLKKKFPLDLLCLLILLVDLGVQSDFTLYLRLIILIKIKSCLQKLQKIQNIFINNFYKEQYWALTKVFLVNFAFAHCLAIILIAMSNLSVQQNWIVNMNIYHSPWYEKYAWAYYWGCNIMLTVGFGDITATNYKEAICLIFIEAFSCILLAYNINCVGALISNIRQQDIEKNKNFKIMRKLAEQNNISEQLQSKVCNFIGESDKMKKKFSFSAEKQFICNLPNELKADILKESNIKIFDNLRFFREFTEKTLLTLAEVIQVKISHPEEIILKSQSSPQFIILRQGQIAYCTKKQGSDFSGSPIDLVNIKKQQDPFVVDLSFLTFIQKEPRFEVKSLNYSMIYKIKLEQFLEIIRNSVLDFQTFCQSRDKCKNILDEYEVIHCAHCSSKHSKMRCPKLHFIPINQLVIYKYLQKVKDGKNLRFQAERIQSQKRNINVPLKIRKYYKSLQQQIYKGTDTSMLTMTKKRILKQDPYQNQLKDALFDMNSHDLRKIARCGTMTLDENKMFVKMEKTLLENINRLFQEKIKNNSNQYLWQIQLDSIHNFKFYFVLFNSSQLQIDLRSKSNKDTQGPKSAKQVLKVLKTMRTPLTQHQYHSNYLDG